MLHWLTALMGPIFAKEMVEMARRKRYYFNRILFGSALLFSLYVIWNSYHWRIRYSGMDYRLMARMAEDLFLAVSWVQFGAVFLFVPVFLCGVIAAEREEHTLDLLFTTDLTNREIVLGKLMSRVAALVLLILSAMPVMSLIMLFGGIDPEALGRALAATLLAILYAGAHAIYFSAATKSPLGALVRTYWWMALWLCGVPLAVFLVMLAIYPNRPLGPFGMYCLGSLPFLNPIGAFVTAIVAPAYNQMAGLLGPWFFAFSFVAPASWSLFLIWRATRRLRREPIPSLFFQLRSSGLTSANPGDRKRAEVQRRHRVGRTWFGMRVRNPFWLRARQARVYDREGHIGRIQWAAWLVAFCFIGLLAVAETRALRHREAALSFLVPTWLAVAVFVALLSGMSLVGDRRRGFLDLVLTTPLTGKEIFDGTLLGVWQHLRRIYWLPWFLGLFFCLTGATTPGWLLASTLVVTLFGAVLLVHGTACALMARTMTPALILTFLLPVVVLVGFPLMVAIFRDAAGVVIFVLAVVVRAGTTYLLRRRANPVIVACHFVATHIILVGFFTWLTLKGTRRSDDVWAFYPAYWLVTLLEQRPQQVFSHSTPWELVFWCYLMALVVNVIWARWWAIHNFDRLVGRLDRAGWRRVRPARSALGKPPALDCMSDSICRG
jgi:ABC-type transport system involved in multi-copper enzyme maturation permease subunit